MKQNKYDLISGARGKNRDKSCLRNAALTGAPIILMLMILLLGGCGKNYSPEQKVYVESILKSRSAKDSVMRFDPSSPFNRKGKVVFHNLNYFAPDPGFVFRSKLIEFQPKDTLTVYGTKGEPRKAVRYGYVLINFGGTEYKVSVYQGTGSAGNVYYSIWFTDKTTNNESYGVGRYLDFEKSEDPEHIYTIDFNLAYNPYCAYSPDFSCAIPTKEDYLPVSITAGEKKFHD